MRDVRSFQHILNPGMASLVSNGALCDMRSTESLGFKVLVRNLYESVRNGICVTNIAESARRELPRLCPNIARVSTNVDQLCRINSGITSDQASAKQNQCSSSSSRMFQNGFNTSCAVNDGDIVSDIESGSLELSTRSQALSTASNTTVATLSSGEGAITRRCQAAGTAANATDATLSIGEGVSTRRSQAACGGSQESDSLIGMRNRDGEPVPVETSKDSSDGNEQLCESHTVVEAIDAVVQDISTPAVDPVLQCAQLSTESHNDLENMRSAAYSLDLALEMLTTNYPLLLEETTAKWQDFNKKIFDYIRHERHNKEMSEFYSQAETAAITTWSQAVASGVGVDAALLAKLAATSRRVLFRESQPVSLGHSELRLCSDYSTHPIYAIGLAGSELLPEPATHLLAIIGFEHINNDIVDNICLRNRNFDSVDSICILVSLDDDKDGYWDTKNQSDVEVEKDMDK